jgi:chaperonin GroES
MKLKPLEDRVVVKVLEQEEMTKEKPSKATVMAVGPGRYDDSGKLLPMPVKEGDIIVFAKYGGVEVKLDGDEYLVLRASDIIGILPKG